MNDLKTIRQLIKMMVDNDLTEIDLEGEGEKIKLKRGGPGGAGSSVQFVTPPPVDAAALPPTAATPPPESGDADIDDGTITIDSPMVGTFYTAANPESDAFVSTGDTVKPDSVVCIIEAMKVYNEIKAEVSGKVVEMLVENGDVVEFGQPLYKVKP